MASTEDPGRQTYHVTFYNCCSWVRLRNYYFFKIFLFNKCHYAELAFQLCSIKINIKLRLSQSRSKIIPCKVIPFPESKNCCFWNHECKKNLNSDLNSTNPNFAYSWNAESKFHCQGIQNPMPGIRNQENVVQNPRVSILPYI